MAAKDKGKASGMRQEKVKAADSGKGWLEELADLFFPRLPRCRICERGVKVNKLPFENMGGPSLPPDLEYQLKGILCDSCKGSLVLIGENYCDFCGRQLADRVSHPAKNTHGQAKSRMTPSLTFANDLASGQESRKSSNYCGDCARLESQGQTRYFRSNRALIKYNDFIQEIIHRFKYYGERDLADFLLPFLEEAVRTYYPASNQNLPPDRDYYPIGTSQSGSQASQTTNHTWDLVMPVPLHEDRLAERGYNQADLLARPLADSLGLAYDDSSLVRLRYTDKQSHRTRAERVQALEGAFGIITSKEGQELQENKKQLLGSSPGTYESDLEAEKLSLLGKRILLTDDIYTTGTTMDACARVLIEAGALSVDCLTLAR